MRKDRLTYFRKQLLDKQRQLTDEVGKTALYGKDQEDDAGRTDGILLQMVIVTHRSG